jgi:hypothetical protein
MDKKIIKGLIDEKLEVIQEQFSIIKEYQGKIPVIEIDLIMVSIRDLYELVLSLQFENTGGVLLKPEHKPATPEVTPPPPPVTVHKLEEETPPLVEEPARQAVETPTPEPEPVRLSSSFISIEPVPKEEPINKPLPQKEEEPVVPEQASAAWQPPAPEPPAPEPFAPEPKATSAPIKEPDRSQPAEKYQRITFDLFSEGAAGTTLADRLKEGQEKRVADKLKENIATDFRTSIGINDKFLFINELFEGNMRIYDEALQKLNASTTMAQADILLLDLKIVYNWDSESPTVKKFVELVRRKF